MKYPSAFLATALVFFSFGGSESSASLILPATEVITVSPGSSPDPGATAGTYVVRERENGDPNANLHISAFANFDSSQFGYFDASSGHTAEFSLELQGRLNTLQNAQLFVGQVTSGTWSTASPPSYNSGTASNQPASGLGPGTQIRQVTLVPNVRTATLNQVYSVDVTTIVEDWINGPGADNGFAIYLSNNFQGAGFDNVQLTIVVPEPSTMLGMLAFGMAALLRRPRRVTTSR